MEVATKVIKRDELDQSFANEVKATTGIDVDLYACYQCGVCSGGCPVNFMMDYTPRQIMRMVQMGMREKVLSSTTIWLCSSCNTCITRCPREIDLPEVMGSLKSIAVKEGIDSKIKEGPVLYKSMVESMKKYGRIHEVGLYTTFARKTGVTKILKQMPFALTLLRKGKLKLFPERIKSLDQLKAIIREIEQLEKED
jgi:heterodisulfide reductase subunit C